MLLLGQYRQKFYPCFEKFLRTTFERMHRSPIENNTRPTLRGTSTCFRGSPGGLEGADNIPPPTLYLFFGTLILFASCGKDFTGLQRYVGLIGNLSPVGRKLLYCVLQVGLFLRHKPFYLCTVGDLASQAFLFMCFVGLQRVLSRAWNTVCQVFCGLRIYLPFWYVDCQMRL